MSRERYQSAIELMAYDDGYEDGGIDVIDEVIQILILFDLDTEEKKKEVINALQKLKEKIND